MNTVSSYGAAYWLGQISYNFLICSLLPCYCTKLRKLNKDQSELLQKEVGMGLSGAKQHWSYTVSTTIDPLTRVSNFPWTAYVKNEKMHSGAFVLEYTESDSNFLSRDMRQMLWPGNYSALHPLLVMTVSHAVS